MITIQTRVVYTNNRIAIISRDPDEGAYWEKEPTTGEAAAAAADPPATANPRRRSSALASAKPTHPVAAPSRSTFPPPPPSPRYRSRLPTGVRGRSRMTGGRRRREETKIHACRCRPSTRRRVREEAIELRSRRRRGTLSSERRTFSHVSDFRIRGIQQCLHFTGRNHSKYSGIRP
jgi:pyruvate/2-oxoglutarate dehydrogenase complex dihydrolipoamide acyltransferase (E2) component